MMFEPPHPPKHMRPPDYRHIMLVLGWVFAAVVVFAALMWFDHLLQPAANLPAAGMAVFAAVSMYGKR